MSNIGNLLNEAGTQMRKQQDATKHLTNKWNKTGLLEGIAHEYDKTGMAVLLENQARQLIDENSSTGTTTSSEQWSGVALPLVRRIFSEIAAKDFVSVQPMNLPSGLVFYLDFKYGSAEGINDGNRFTKSSDIFGNTSASGDPAGGLYGAGRYGYSIKDKSATRDSLTFATASWKEADFDSDQYSASSAITALVAKTGDAPIKLTKVSFGIGDLSNVDKLSVRSWAITGSSIDAADNISQFNFLTDANGNEVVLTDNVSDSVAVSASMFLNLSPGAGGASSSLFLNYKAQPADTSRGDFEDTTGGNPDKDAAGDIQIPEIDVQLRSEAIVAKTRKLKAVWSPEFAQDLNAYHSIDAEAELTSMLSEYVSMEIDLEILDMLIQNALTVDYWSATIGETINAEGTAFVAASNAEAYQQGTWFQTLGTKIQKVSNKIHQKTLRGGANFVVCSPEVATILESIPGYAADTDGTAIGKTGFAMGVQKVGALNNRYTVYKNPYMTENTILLGFRGTQFLETGAVYAPYIPLIMTPLVYDPQNFTPRKGVMTRYAKKIVRPEFYGKIHVKDLNKL